MLRNATTRTRACGEIGGIEGTKITATAKPTTATSPTIRWPRAARILPGRLRIERGTFPDYRALERFHYAPGRPSVPAGVWRVVYEPPGPRPRLRPRPCPRLRARASTGAGSVAASAGHAPVAGGQVFQIADRAFRARLVAVAVLAYPPPASRARERTLNLTGPRYGPKLGFANAHVRTIARVIVHPQFRGIGIAALLVRRICSPCPTRYVEAFAAMGEVHPLFEDAGMTRVPAASDDEAAYFIFDRHRRKGGHRET